ncbi:MAG: maleylacetoacetate isomerase, partial [Phenylobacterium sp.]|nr:maleylacetoacetate isomerase [Phenylobacterium sp.]
MTLTLYNFWAATAPYRVRIGLALKGLEFDTVPVDLRAGDQHGEAYRARNPQGLAPALETEGGELLTQSLAILEWLEETYPSPPLLPPDALGRARVRAMAAIVACDIHPLNNLRVHQALQGLGVAREAVTTWSARWVSDGFDALEAMVARHGGTFAYGDAPGLADCLLIPQVYAAARYDLD